MLRRLERWSNLCLQVVDACNASPLRGNNAQRAMRNFTGGFFFDGVRSVIFLPSCRSRGRPQRARAAAAIGTASRFPPPGWRARGRGEAVAGGGWAARGLFSGPLVALPVSPATAPALSLSRAHAPRVLAPRGCSVVLGRPPQRDAGAAAQGDHRRRQPGQPVRRRRVAPRARLVRRDGRRRVSRHDGRRRRGRAVRASKRAAH